MWRKIFYKYLFSYLAIFMVPFLILSTLILTVFLKDFRAKTAEVEREIIQRTVRSVEVQWETVKKLAMSIGSNTAFLPEIINRNPYYPIETIENLAAFRNQNSLYLDIIYTLMDSTKSYGSTSSYNTADIPQQLYRIPAITDAQYRLWLSGQSSEKMIGVQYVQYGKDGWKKRLMLSIHSIPLNSIAPYGTLMFLIYPEILFSEVDWFTGLRDGAVTVKDAAETVIYAAGRDFSRSESVRSRSVTYFSEPEAWTYTWTMPSEAGFEEADALENQFFFALLFSLVFSIGVILLMMQVNYKPLCRIKNTLEKELHRQIGVAEGMEGLHDLILMLLKKNTSLEDVVNNSTDLFKDRLLRGILLEELDEEGIDGIGLRLATPLKAEKYGAVVLTTYSAGNAEKPWLAETLRYLKENFTDNGENNGLFGCLTFNNDIVIVLTRTIPDETVYFKALLDEIEESIGIRLVCGIGRMYPKRVNIALSRREAADSVEQHIHAREKRVIVFGKDSITRDLSNPERKQFLDRLKGILLTADIAGWEQTLQELAARIAVSRCALTVIHHFMVNIIETVETAIPGLYTRLPDFPSVESVAPLSSQDEILAILNRIREQILTVLRESRDDDIITRAKTHIEKHHKDPNLSIESVAHELDVSYCYLSRSFKAKCGIGLNEYLIRYRIERFKQFAPENDAPISELVTKIGYRGTYQFSRIFKKHEGMTPSEYRKARKSQKSLNPTKSV